MLGWGIDNKKRRKNDNKKITYLEKERDELRSFVERFVYFIPDDFRKTQLFFKDLGAFVKDIEGLVENGCDLSFTEKVNNQTYDSHYVLNL